MTDTARAPGRPKDPDLELRNKARILDAAAVLFAERGFADTHVQTIADTLGVGNGTVYRYFPTKEKLFLAAVERGLAELTAEMDAVLAAPSDDPLDVMRNAVRGYLRFFHRRPQMAELFIQERAAFRHHHRPLYFVSKAEDNCKHVAFFQVMQEAGLVRDLPQERFFAVIEDLLYGTILTNLLSGRTVDPDAQADDVLDVIFHGVLTESARKKLTKKEKR
jgi:AcrR family transcriptional regulator